MYPALGLSKKDVIEYHIRIATRMLVFLQDRALVRTRFPDGINGENFYEKDIPKGTPEWVETFTRFSRSSDRDTEYVVCNDLDTLLWLANLAAIELHIPLSRISEIGAPDLVLFDIDPEPPAGLGEVVQVAYMLKKKLDESGVRGYVKTSGRKGLHIIIPVEPIYSFEETRDFVHGVGSQLAEESEIVVSERSQTTDPGTVLIDYPQNSERSTMIAPYSLRPTREATVSTPLDWSELSSLRPFDWNIFNVPERAMMPWADLWSSPETLDI
jgi:bifunctional non-homologous end joining protein LigD